MFRLIQEIRVTVDGLQRYGILFVIPEADTCSDDNESRSDLASLEQAEYGGEGKVAILKRGKFEVLSQENTTMLKVTLGVDNPKCDQVPKLIGVEDANQRIYGWRGAVLLLTVEGLRKDVPQGLVASLGECPRFFSYELNKESFFKVSHESLIINVLDITDVAIMARSFKVTKQECIIKNTAFQ